MGDRELILTGGGPWGFTLSGGKDFGAPLKVSKVNKPTHTHAHTNPQIHQRIVLLQTIVSQNSK